MNINVCVSIYIYTYIYIYIIENYDLINDELLLLIIDEL